MAATLLIACNHLIDLLLDLMVFWEGSRTPNLLHPVGHVQLALVEKQRHKIFSFISEVQKKF
jgi:hypothetical protein